GVALPRVIMAEHPNIDRSRSGWLGARTASNEAMHPGKTYGAPDRAGAESHTRNWGTSFNAPPKRATCAVMLGWGYNRPVFAPSAPLRRSFTPLCTESTHELTLSRRRTRSSVHHDHDRSPPHF